MLTIYGHDAARIELVDGSYHDVDSSSLAFFIASAMALDNALRQLPPSPSSGDDDPGVRVPRLPQWPVPRTAASVPEPIDPDFARVIADGRPASPEA